MESVMVECRGLSYRYHDGTPALAEIDLQIERGAFVLLAGASGSGKSTLCRVLNGLIPHLHGGDLHGVMRVDGHDIRTTPPHVLSRSVGLVLQNPDAQCFGTTVARDLAFGLACQGLDRETIAQRVQVVASRLDLTHLLNRAPYTLSGGEQQRVALAGVLALQPALLVLDEPFAFLDAAGADQLRAIFRRLHQQGITIIVAEHRLAELVDEATRMVVLHNGQIVADGTPSDVLAQNVTVWGLEQFNVPDRPLNVPSITPSSRPLAPGTLWVWHPSLHPSVEWDHIQYERDGRVVLRDVSLAATAGEVLALLGANGAGKTTLLQHANGLLRPQRGEVRVLGRPVGRRPVAELAREIGLVVQQPAHMLFAPTVRDELAAGPRALKRYDPAWCAELVERWGLEPLLQRNPHRLSAGQQRRVALAAVLASRPQVLLLDEPNAGMDAVGRQLLHAMIEAVAQAGVAVVLTTHDSDWAYVSATRWAVLADGQLVADAAPAQLCAQPAVLEHARVHLPRAVARQQPHTRMEDAHAVE